MERLRHTRTRASVGFTLVELLVVMGIIGLLVGLLMPAVQRAIIAARVGRTKAIIQSLSVGLEAFKADWGVYPPSDNGGDDDLEGASSNWTGAPLMGYALMGPDGKGWGVRAADQSGGSSDWVLPFGGQARKAYGPYFTQESGDTLAIRDAFPTFGESVGLILYYRFDPRGTSGESDLYGNYEHDDNPAGAGDWRDYKGFNDRNHFLLSVRYEDMNRVSRWQREDYLLISPGPDRYYGHVYFDPRNPDVVRAATQNDAESGKAVYDDVTNFL
ncbi:MAG TPA: type II secretion system protein [Phycisphaerae bacterium]|nr:type II secretion system protein [Phycisphaerae bacterium]